MGTGHPGDARLDRRLQALVEQLSARLGASIPFACQDWAATKAAHRFFANPRVSEAAILAGHFEAIRARAQASGGRTFVLHDTTAFSFQRTGLAGAGFITRPRLHRGSGLRGYPAHLTVRGNHAEKCGTRSNGKQRRDTRP